MQCLGRYKVDDVLQEEREDCYLATLRINDADATDSRAYYLAVENDRGTDRHAVQLYVNGKYNFIPYLQHTQPSFCFKLYYF